jgi:raffinose/stachyose/melibiose transport system permease protein
VSRPTVGALRLGRWRRNATHEGAGLRRSLPYAYILPAFLAYFVLAFIPLVQTGWVSLHEWDGIADPVWVGIDNYRLIVEDALIRKTFANVLLLIVFHSLLPVAVGLFLAAVMTRIVLRGIGFFRVVLFLPYTISLVVVAIAWQWIYAPQGPGNAALDAVGLGSLTRAWLGDFTFALPAVGLAATWVTFGFPLVLFLAGITKIPASLYDAARIDGAGALREFFAVTLPALRNEFAIALGFTIITTLRSFALVYVMTQGGPGETTRVPAIEIYERAFVQFQAGSAAAIGITLTIMIFLVTIAIVFAFERGQR